MTPLFKKLNYKNQECIFCFNAPNSFDSEIKTMSKICDVKTELKQAKNVDFAMAFVTTLKDVEKFANAIGPKLNGDAVFWMCYPKGTSKKYKCDFNRDTGWEVMGNYNLETVRAVAIDEDWSALRFRKVEFIKAINRKFETLSKAGKAKQNKK